MADVLVTGAAGFIGARLVEMLAGRGHQVTGVDCFLPDLYSAEMKKSPLQSLGGNPRGHSGGGRSAHR